ncbi:hypothetical protein [Candidatus Pantoea persica]|nr:hypothetical protein [Candidatus Pantoea persica]MBA2816645.1 hypothetical protein [Candidatus Pantoea persica]
MKKSSSQMSQWQYWLSFSAFTLAETGFEGSMPPLQAKCEARRKRTLR